MKICPQHGKAHFPTWVRTPDGYDRIANNAEHKAQLIGQPVDECGELIAPPAEPVANLAQTGETPVPPAKVQTGIDPFGD